VFLTAGPAIAASPYSACLPDAAVPMRVRIDGGAPLNAVLDGGLETPLTLFDAATGRLLWSAGSESIAIQVIAGMDAPVTGSITVLDLDGDGLHDRIYVGDMAARLWRLDVRHGTAAREWAIGGMFADFSNPEGRGFVAPADVVKLAPPGEAPRLEIAIGTAAPGNSAASNRFYVLRDPLVASPVSPEELGQWIPLRESGLMRVEPGADSTFATAPATTGWYVELGQGHVVAPAITTAHRTVLAIATLLPGESAPCEVFAHLVTIDREQQRVMPATAASGPARPADWRVLLNDPVHVSASFRHESVSTEPAAACMLGSNRVPGCDVDLRPRRTWWRRSDAE
jgi:hypothetical protein